MQQMDSRLGPGQDGAGLEQERDRPSVKHQGHAGAGLQAEAEHPARSPQAWVQQTNIEMCWQCGRAGMLARRPRARLAERPMQANKSPGPQAR